MKDQSSVATMSNGKTMENLDKLDKLLGQFPASRAVFYAEKLGWSRSKVYDNLNSLQIRQLAYNKNGLWYPSTEQKPSKEDKKGRRSIKSGFGFFEWWKHRNEQKRLEEERVRKELLARKWTSMELFAKANPDIGEVVQNWLDVEKKTRKELGLDSE